RSRGDVALAQRARASMERDQARDRRSRRLVHRNRLATPEVRVGRSRRSRRLAMEQRHEAGMGRIKSAIEAVVNWFRDTAWPIVETVIGWLQQSFEGWKIILGAVWDFVKNRIINPVITWFRDTAWPMIKSVIDFIIGGFDLMKITL